MTVVEIDPQLAEWGVTFAADAFDDPPGLRPRGPADHRPTRLDDAGFFHGDASQAVPELLRVVEADAGDERHHRPAHIRGIEPPSQPDLHDGCLHSPADEMQKAQSGGHFEEGGSEW